MTIDRSIPNSPTIRPLERDRCEVILRQQHVGRVAFARHDRVDITPLHYVYVDGWIYGRTSPGAKMEIVAHNRWVAFEVNEVTGLFDWRSVVVHGAWYAHEQAPPSEHDAWTRGIAALQALLPGTLTADDPVPFRTIVFRIHAAEITGRECRPS